MASMDLTGALDRFLSELRADGRAVHTVEQYRRHVLAFARWAAEESVSADVGEVSHETLARFLGSPAALTGPDGRRRKAGSVNALRSSLEGFWRYLHQAGHVAEDPGAQEEPMTHPASADTDPPPPEDSPRTSAPAWPTAPTPSPQRRRACSSPTRAEPVGTWSRRSPQSGQSGRPDPAR